MSDSTDTTVDDAATATATTASEHSQEVSSSSTQEVTPEGKTEGQEATQPQGQVPTQPEFDPLKVLDTLELDPKVKEDLKNGYLRQSDYTKKTQELAEQRGLLDEYTQVRPIIEFLGKNPELFNQVVAQMSKGQETKPQGQESIPDDPRAYADWVKAETIKEFQAIQAKDREYQEASLVDPRLNSDPEFGEMIAKMVANDAEFRSGSITASEATKRAVVNFDKYISKQVSSAKNTLSEKAKLKKIGSSTRTSAGNVSGQGKPASIMEAAKMAEDELTN